MCLQSDVYYSRKLSSYVKSRIASYYSVCSKVSWMFASKFRPFEWGGPACLTRLWIGPKWLLRLLLRQAEGPKCLIWIPMGPPLYSIDESSVTPTPTPIPNHTLHPSSHPSHSTKLHFSSSIEQQRERKKKMDVEV